jgi:hypothetical protein
MCRVRKLSTSDKTRSSTTAVTNSIPPSSSTESEQPTVAAAATEVSNSPRSAAVSVDEVLTPSAVVSVDGDPLRLPPAVQRSSVVCAQDAGGLPSTPLLDSTAAGNASGRAEKIAEIGRNRKLSEPSSPPATRHRRVSGRPPTTGSGASAHIRRKAEHRKRFVGGVPERRSMTMFDLIYYNPENGSRMQQSAAEEEAAVAVPEEEVVDNPEPEVAPADAAAEPQVRSQGRRGGYSSVLYLQTFAVLISFLFL